MTYCDGVRAGGKGLAAHVCEETGNLVLVDLIKLGVATLSGIHNILSQELLRDLALFLLFVSLLLCCAFGDLLL